ncbi:ATPase RavA [Moorella thermoacetica]|uniref:ATPase RavA n=1 Tax=Neomoorella thermoacetica TaxID=1525 RepID=A0AAC9HI51_NEOTH|nr:AAA family ATPase [Moorella thermoacetica]AOQ24582.1 ATPase RavA [Moorella thermoacetica]TYL12683.1 ATPase RavA [Moorella thermoacetica]
MTQRELVGKFNAIRDYMNKNFLQREEVVDGCLTALVARQHVLLLGPPGTAKTNLIAALASCLTGGQHFQWLVTKFTTPEELFGPVSLEALERDSYRRVTAGKLPEATTAMLDEVFKSSSAILNTLLTIINERRFYNDGTVTEVPLITVFGASNEVPAGDEEVALAAFADRFLLWYEVNYLEEDGVFARMLRLNNSGRRPEITIDEVLQAGEMARQVVVNDDTIDALVLLRRQLRDEGITVSDRRWRQVISLLQAQAFLHSDVRVQPQRDLMILKHALWTAPDQKITVQKIVRNIIDPFGEAIEEVVLEAKEIYQNAMDKGDAPTGAEALQKLKALRTQLDELRAKGAVVDKYVNLLHDYHREVLNKCMGIDLL